MTVHGLRPRLRGKVLAGGLMVLLLCIGGLRCGSNIGGGNGDDPDLGAAGHVLSYLEVQPLNDVLTVDVNQQGSLDYHVIAHYADGTTEDVTDKVSLMGDNAAVGSFSAG